MLGLNSDQNLINRALRGSEPAWTKLVKRHEGRVYNHLLRMTGQPADAMDLLQEVFVAVYRNLPNYRGDGALQGWILRIATNKTLDKLRRKKPQEQQFDEMPEQEDDFGPSQALIARRRNQAILTNLNRLKPEQRVVVEFKFFQQMTFEEIAGQLDISPATAKTRLYAGMRKLRESMEVRDAVE